MCVGVCVSVCEQYTLSHNMSIRSVREKRLPFHENEFWARTAHHYTITTKILCGMYIFISLQN